MSTPNRIWRVLDWNIRGINSQERWDDISNKINESNCNIICMQETKREVFDSAYIKKFCPRRLNQFAYVPSLGSSGGIITIWNGSMYNGTVISQNAFHITVALTCTFTDRTWHLTNIYAPCNIEGRNDFIQWFADLDSSEYDLWMLVGDFNLIRSSEDRNRPGGNVSNMIMFNSLI
jgi:exonuclease III